MKWPQAVGILIAILFTACTGNPGAKGEVGAVGQQGPQGEQGLVGQTGSQGLQGEQGPRGEPPSEAELIALIDDLVTERMKDIQGEQGIQGIQGERGEVGLTGLTGPQGVVGPRGSTGIQGQSGVTGPAGPQGEPGSQVILHESRLGSNLSFDTAPQGQTWLSGLTLTIELAVASTVQITADSDVEFPGGGYTFLVGIATSATAPSITQEYGSNTNTAIKITSKRMISLTAGTHTFHFMAFNQTGAPSFKNLVMTALAVEE